MILEILSSLHCNFLQAGNDFMGVPFLYHHKDKIYASDAKDPLQSPRSVSGTKNGLLRKVCLLLLAPKLME